jgi:hypothetical protein
MIDSWDGDQGDPEGALGGKTPTDDSLDRVGAKGIDVVVEEYRALQEEKRTAYRSSTQLMGLMLTASAALVAVIAQWDKPLLILVLPPTQLSLIGLMVAASATAVRMSAYLSVVEKRVQRLAGSQLLRWETVHLGQWSPIGIMVLRLEDPIASSMLVVMAIVGLAIVVELVFAFYTVREAIADNVYWSMLFVLYLAVIVIFASIVFVSYLITRKWATDFASRQQIAEDNMSFYPLELAVPAPHAQEQA